MSVMSSQLRKALVRCKGERPSSWWQMDRARVGWWAGIEDRSPRGKCSHPSQPAGGLELWEWRGFRFQVPPISFY